MIKIYAGEYQILDVSITHNQLLLRCVDADTNYDLLFVGVINISLPFRFSIDAINVNVISDTSSAVFILKNGNSVVGELIACQLKQQVNNLTVHDTSIPSEIERLSRFGDDIEELINQIEKGSYLISDEWFQIFPPPTV